MHVISISLTWINPVFFFKLATSLAAVSGSVTLIHATKLCTPRCLLPLYRRLLSEVQKVNCPPMQLHFSAFAQFVICGLRCFCCYCCCYQRPVLDVDWRSFDLNIGLLLDSHFINKVWINRNWGERNIFSLRQNNFSNEKAILGGFWEATNRFWISTHNSENKFDGWHMKVEISIYHIVAS